ncbi:hypothetical protein [Enterocloster sp.]|uniref:hypothetical protein n=1 Tax=Enterocloster sp. TaxID=2719315 RepID=UPI00399F3E63
MYQSAVNSTGGVLGTAAGTNGAQYGYGTLMGSIITDMTASTPSQVGGLNACLNAQGFFITASVPDKSTSMTGTDTAEITANIKGAGYEYTRVGQFQLDSRGTHGQEKLCLRFRTKTMQPMWKPITWYLCGFPPAKLSIAADGTSMGPEFDDDANHC